MSRNGVSALVAVEALGTLYPSCSPVTRISISSSSPVSGCGSSAVGAVGSIGVSVNWVSGEVGSTCWAEFGVAGAGSG